MDFDGAKKNEKKKKNDAMQLVALCTDKNDAAIWDI